MNREDLEAIFREEAAELIDRFGQLVQSLKNAAAEDMQAIYGELYRVAHNLKGAAHTVSNKGILALAHQVEEDLEPYKADPSSITAATIERLKEATSALQMLLEDANNAAERNGDVVPGGEKHDPVSPTLKDQTSIRVGADRFDALMGYSGAILMARARMEARHHRLRRLAEVLERGNDKRSLDGGAWDRAVEEINDIIQSDNRDLLDFGYLTDGINHAMKRMRMVPLRLAERGWREIARKAAHETGKRLEMVIRTGNIELDKNVLDQLREPIMHLIRNAVDHGIEPSEERVAAGKPAEGRLDIEAAVQGAMVRITVRDDGKGVERERIWETALALRLMDENQLSAMSDQELLDLLFHPGFSTAKEVSTVSGRGVGLDVVRARIESFGGRIGIWSPPDRSGTTFHLSIPLSLLSTVGLHVMSGDTAYTLPLEYVQSMTSALEEETELMDGYWVLKQKDADPIRIVELAELLGNPNKSARRPDKVVILSRSNLLLGLLVDQVEGHFEFVAQPLPWNLERLPGINGVSLRPDGSVVVDLDVPYLFELAGNITGRNGSMSKIRTSSVASTAVSARRVLLVDDSLACRTMEKNILLDAGYHVVLAENGKVAWERLAEGTFDCLVSDVDMPEMNGLELTRRVRSTDKLRDLPVILVTNLDKPEDRTAGADAGADEYIVKGTFDQKTLLEAVSKYI